MYLPKTYPLLTRGLPKYLSITLFINLMIAYTQNQSFYLNDEGMTTEYKHKKNLVDKLVKLLKCNRKEAEEKIYENIPMEELISKMEKKLDRQEMEVKAKTEKMIELNKRYEKVMKRTEELNIKRSKLNLLEENITNKLNGGNYQNLPINDEEEVEQVSVSTTESSSQTEDILPSEPTQSIKRVNVTLGVNEVECYFYEDENEEEFNLHTETGELVGTAEYMNVGKISHNDRNIDDEGFWHISKRRVYLYEIKTDKETLHLFGEISSNFKEHPYYCELNTKPNRYIEVKNITKNYDNELYITSNYFNNLINYT